MAVRLLNRKRSPKASLAKLVAIAGISRRQAYRYLRLARKHSTELPVPEPKAVFTVNLPKGLIRAVRARSRRLRRPISHEVASALEKWLKQDSNRTLKDE